MATRAKRPAEAGRAAEDTNARDRRAEARDLRARRKAIQAEARQRQELAYAVMVRAVRNWVGECHQFADRLEVVAADKGGGGEIIAFFHHYHDDGEHQRGDERAAAVPAEDVAAALQALAEATPADGYGVPGG